MKNITRLFVPATVAALVAAAANAAPFHLPSVLPSQTSIIRPVRLVCDQNCHCWRTGYLQRRHDRQEVGDQDPNYCPSGGHYNGYYRTGPSVGLGFESRFPAPLFPF